MTIFLQAPGAKGNVSAQGYQGWVSLLQFSLNGVRRSVEQRTGSIYNRMSGPKCGLVWLQKLSDNSSPFWLNYSTNQDVISQVDIHFVTAGNPLETYLSYTLTNAVVSLYTHEHSMRGSSPVESILLAYDTFEQSYFPRASDNTLQSPVRWGGNISHDLSSL